MAELPHSQNQDGSVQPDSHPSILIVDDNSANLLSLHAILDDLGPNVVEASSGEEALRLAATQEFAVILLDVLMPGTSGFETARTLRTLERSRHTPIIFLTAQEVDQSQLEEGYGIGAVDFLIKPILPIALRAKVKGFLELYQDKLQTNREAELLRMLVQGTSDYAIFMIDPEGQILTWNLGAERLKGYTADEIIGRHFSTFYPQEANDRGWPDYELEVAKREGRFEDEGWRIRKDGTQFWANVVITTLRDKQGQLRGFSKVTRDLTTRKNADEELRRSEERFRLLVEGANDYAIFLLDPEGHIASWNPGAERIKQYKAEEIIGQHFSRFYPQEVIDRGWPEHELRVATQIGRFEDEGWRVRKDGSQFWANVVITALRDDQGRLRGFSKLTRDMTERKRSEENARRLAEETAARRGAEQNAGVIQEQRERLRVTLSSIGDAVISTDAEGRVNFLNPVAEQLLGYRNDEASGQHLPDVFRIVNEQSRQIVENPAAKALREGTVVALSNHTILISKHGTECPIDDSAAPIRDADGQVIGSVLVFRDITETKRAQRAIRESEGRFRQLSDAMPQIVWSARPDGYIDYLNHRWYEFTGQSPDEGNSDWDEIIHPDDLKKSQERWAISVRTGSPFEMHVRLRDYQRHGYRWHLIRTVAVRDESGSVTRWFGTSTDIDEQTRAAQSSRFLAEASAALSRVVDYESTLQKVVGLAIPYFADWAAVDVIDSEGNLRRLAISHQNPDKVRLANELMREYPADPDSPQGILAVFRSGKPEIVQEITDEMISKGAIDQRHLYLIRSLGLRSFICAPLVVSGKSFGVLTFATAESGRAYSQTDLALAEDLAHRAAVAIENTQLYQALRESDRRKDEFLATLAHELRNPLAPIRNSLQILKMPRVDAAMAQEARDMMERQIHHLVRLVDDLLDVSRVMRAKIELRRERIELATIVARAVETAKPLIEVQGHRLDISVTDESLLLDVDPVRIVQVVGNLLTNAAKYTDRNGHIWLAISKQDNKAVLSVRDNGIGIAPDMLPHVFDLFVQADNASTKSQGGLGIGLTLAKNLVALHGGTIEAESAGLGQGSEFIVRLPLAARSSDGKPDANEPEEKQHLSLSGFRVLVVDDNRDAAISLSMLLRLQGHEVRVAHDGPAALQMAKEFHPHMMFLDIGMPGMDGYEVARRIRKMPGLERTHLAALTGWGQQEDRRRTAAAGFDHHLVKPPEPKMLESLLADLKASAS